MTGRIDEPTDPTDPAFCSAAEDAGYLRNIADSIEDGTFYGGNPFRWLGALNTLHRVANRLDGGKPEGGKPEGGT